MFDKVNYTQHETVVTPVTQIIEKSVSPDKVADLYLEAKKEVRSEYIESERVDNIVNANYSMFRDVSGDFIIRYIVTINGNEVVGEERLLDREVSMDGLLKEPLVFFLQKILASQVEGFLRLLPLKNL